MKNIKKCGKATQIYKGEYKNYYKKYQCKDIRCDSCRNQIKDKLINQINYYVPEYGLNRFFTLTTKGDYNELMEIWRQLKNDVKLLKKEHYIKYYIRNKKISEEEINEKYNNYIKERIDYELACFYLFEYDELKYKNYNNIAIIITNLIINNELETLPKLKELSRHNKAKVIRESKKYSKRFIEMTSTEKFNLFNDLKDLFIIMIDTGKDDVEKRRLQMHERITRNIYEHDFEYIWTLEFQENGNPHLHILSNYYINYYTIHKFWTEQTNITKDIDLENWNDEENENDRISEYITKYITKETIELKEKLDTNIQILGSTRNINIDLEFPKFEIDEEDKIELKYSETINYKIPPNMFGEINTDIETFKKQLKGEEILEKNKFIKEIYEELKETKERIEKGKNKDEEWNNFNKYKNEKSLELIKEELEKRNNVETIKLKTINKIPENTDPKQREFIEAVLDKNTNIIVLEGKAGTGKSTSIKFLLDAIDKKDLIIEVISLTGKASSVIGNITGLEGKTIHRLAEAQFNEIPDFIHGENNKLEADVVIIDEISMCDLLTLASIINAIKDNAKIILLGDSNQLNPIKSNNILKILKNQKKYNNIKNVELIRNYRSEDNINKLAMKVLDGKAEELEYQKPENIDIENLIKEGYQILTNTNKLSHKINKGISMKKKDIKIGKYTYDINDEIMIIKNDKIKKIFNGEIATIENFDNNYIYINKEGRTIKYNYIEASNSIRPSKSITIHKSQGSEYEKVAIVLENKDLLLSNNLLYTAITRAQKEVIIIDYNNIDKDKLNQKAIEPYDLEI